MLAVLVVLTAVARELPYRSCLQSVEVRYPVAYQPGKSNGDNPWATYREQFGIGPHAHFVFYKKGAARPRYL